MLIKLFADDAKLYSVIENQQKVVLLQRNITNAEGWADVWRMFFHNKKCHHMHIGNQDTAAKYEMTQGEEKIEIERVKSEKDLGVIMDNKLNFREHITKKVNIANRNLGIIFRTFTFLDKDMFLNLYKSIVRPHIEYATQVWSPMYKKDKILLENVQRRATRLVKCVQNLSYPERLRALGLPSLEYRRERADVVQVYKILNNIDKMEKNKLFTMAPCKSTRGHPLKLYKRKARLNVRFNSFGNRVVNLWNSLPESVVMAPSLNTFKSRLNKHWYKHPFKFNAACYMTEPEARQEKQNQKAPTEAEMA